MTGFARAIASPPPAMAPALLTGERLVVFLFAARVALAAPVHLAAPLALLAAAALAVELAVDGSAAASDSSPLRRFKTRPGASSGILLGATTLPSVMLSRLIQLSRILQADPNGPEEFAYLEMQYWAASISCLSVLAFFLWHLRQSPSNKISIDLKYGSLLVVLCLMTYFVSFLLKTHGGLMAMTNMMYLLSHGVAAVILIKHILEKFPSCSSFGEALLVSSGLVLYFGDMLAHTLSKMGFSVSSEAVIHTPGTRSDMATIIQGILLGLFLLPLLYKSSLQVWDYCRTQEKQRPQAVKEHTQKRIGSAVFYVSLLVVLLFLVPSWTRLIKGLEVHPFVWIVNYMFTDSHERLALCAYWICVIYASVRRFYSISKQSKTERILLRKYYHLVAVLIFSPAVIFQPAFLDLAFGAAFGVFLILEMIRIWEIYPLGRAVHQFMNSFTDHRDSEILIVSHFSLLLGCALPKWMSSGLNDRPLAPFAGILSLGIGDTMASMIGYKYGVLRWSKTGKKTIEGTAAGITSVLAACSILVSLLASSGYILSQNWLSLLIAVTLSGLLEAYTAQLDNAFIPLVFYSLLCL
ncbi:dolichol kinase EVAN-like [Phragmites australis]|uniref:dolichol kinase EVAN-like n=1 Tax=Phragmites australis TaxID=29695 RepID=UPI002D77C92F|nr:dolichol kinase EVAN-like [Phragmites australis]